MVESFDVAIIGAGTMGSAAAYHLSLRNRSVLLLEQFDIVHELGSHSGATRIIRHAYFESPDYVPLVIRADQLWCELQALAGIPLLIRTGGIDAGSRDSILVKGALEASRSHHLVHEVLSSSEITKRWPQFYFPSDWEACYDPQMGFLLVDDCIRTHVRQAEKQGAVIHQKEPVISFQRTGKRLRIRTQNAEYAAEKVVVCAGAWTSKILVDLGLPLVVKRKTLAWLKAENPKLFEVGAFPIFLAQTDAGVLYGFPIYGKEGVKIANHHSGGQAVDPNEVDRKFYEADAADIREFVQTHMRGLTSELLDGKVCLYTLTPDEDFIIDFHPQDRDILIAAGFSGHGFKFAPVVGEILADLCIDGATRHPIERFALSRFG